MLKKIIIGMLVISLCFAFRERFYSWDTVYDKGSASRYSPQCHENLLYTAYLDAGDIARTSTGWEIDSYKGHDHLVIACLMTGCSIAMVIAGILVPSAAEKVVCFVLAAMYLSLAAPLWFVLGNLVWMEQYQAYSDETTVLHGSGLGGKYHKFEIGDTYQGLAPSYVSLFAQGAGHCNPVSHAGKREQTLDLCLLRGDESEARYHHQRVGAMQDAARTNVGFAFHCLTDTFAHGKLYNRMVYEMKQGFFQAQELDISMQELYRRYLSGSGSENQLYREFLHTDDDMVWGDGCRLFGEAPDDISKGSDSDISPVKEFKKQINEHAYRMAYLSARDWFVAIFKDKPNWYGLPACAVWWE